MGVRLNVTEWMRGEVVDQQNTRTRFVHEVLIQIEDIDGFIADPRHDAPMSGWVWWGDQKCKIDTARFDMLVATTKASVKHMYYRIVFTDGAGAKRTMLGHKMIRDDPGFDLWGDITTLFIRIYDGVVDGISLDVKHGEEPTYPDGEFATGKLLIPLRDGVTSFLSFDAPGGSPLDTANATSKFIRFYASEAFELFVRQSSRKRTVLWAAIVLAGLAITVGVVFALR
jgi:cholesterol oxidase